MANSSSHYNTYKYVTYVMLLCELPIFHYITLLLLLSPLLLLLVPLLVSYFSFYRCGSKESFIVIRTEENKNGWKMETKVMVN